MNCIYIDASNLEISSKEHKFNYDIFNLLKFLKDKYKADSCKYFTTNLTNESFLEELREMNVEVILKKSYKEKLKFKANCDVEISHEITKDVERGLSARLILISGDGDFYNLLKYVLKNEVLVKILSVHPSNTSKLIKSETDFNLTFISQIIEKINKRKALARHERLARVLFNNLSITK